MVGGLLRAWKLRKGSLAQEKGKESTDNPNIISKYEVVIYKLGLQKIELGN